MDYIEDRKYWKILKGKNIKTINHEVLNFLLEKNIIVEDNFENPFKIEYSKDLPSTEKKENIIEFERYIIFESKQYEINKNIGKEIYNALKFITQEIEGVDEWKKAEIEIELEGIIGKEEKLLFLENKHSQLFSEVKKEPEFLIYTGKREFNGYDNWEELIIDEIMSDENYILNYLTNGEAPSLDFNKLWLKYFQLNDLIEYCKKLYNDINENPTNVTTSKGLDTSKQVLLLEAIRNIKDWEELSATKKGKIVSLLIDKNHDNIKDVYLQLDKKQSENTKKFTSDKTSIDTLIANLLG